MKTKEELNILKNELETLNAKLAELTGEELEQVTGGIAPGRVYWKNNPRPKNDNTSGNNDDNGNN